MLLANLWTSLQNMGIKCIGIVLALAILLLMVLIHELGHYTFGKIFKFKINEFSIGFGKAIYSKTKANGEKFSIRVVPLGGYCAFEGEDEANNDSEGAFNNQAPWKRLLVLFGGVLFNFISAVIFSVLLTTIIGTGIPKVGTVQGPNAAYIQTGDEILSINGEKPSFVNGGISFILKDYDQYTPIEVVLDRDGEIITQTLYKQPFEDALKDTYYALGVMNDYSYVKYGVGEAIVKAVPYTCEMAVDTLQLLFKLFTGQLNLQYISGPISTIDAMSDSMTAANKIDLTSMVLLFPLLAVNLAVFNALPIPALDGARMVFVLIEWIRKKPINRDLEAKIHFWGLVALFGFVILVEVLHFTVFR